MKGIISNHSALNAYQRQSAIEPVTVRESPATGEAGGVAGTPVRAARVSISAEARALAGGEAGVDRAKVDRLRQNIASGNLKFDSQLIAQRLIDQGE